MQEENKETTSTPEVTQVELTPVEPVETTAPEPTPKVEEKPVKTYEEEYKSLKKEKEELTQKLYQTQMSNYVKGLGLVDDIYEEKLSNVLKFKGVKFEDGNVTGADETLKEFKEKYPQAFKSSKIPRFVGDTQGEKQSSDDSVLRKIMGLKPRKED